MVILINEDKNSDLMSRIEVGKFYKALGQSFDGRIGEDFLYDFDFCGECVSNNGIIARIRFGNLDEDRYCEIYPDFGFSKFTANRLREITYAEYKKVIDTYNDRIEETFGAKYPMPVATV
jgi:hypothetical protein